MTLTLAQKITVLRSYGFFVGNRAPHRKPAYRGCFMVHEMAGEESPDDDEWCVVGDSLEELVEEAFDLASIYDRFESVCANVLAGGDGVLPRAAAGPEA